MVAMKGKVKWFNNAHGYGFVIDRQGHDVFVHYTVIQQPGYKTLKEGEEVEFEMVAGVKGKHATVVYPQAAAQ